MSTVLYCIINLQYLYVFINIQYKKSWYTIDLKIKLLSCNEFVYTIHNEYDYAKILKISINIVCLMKKWALPILTWEVCKVVVCSSLSKHLIQGQIWLKIH